MMMFFPMGKQSVSPKHGLWNGLRWAVGLGHPNPQDSLGAAG